MTERFAQVQGSIIESWNKIVTEQTARVVAAQDEMTKLQGRGVDEMRRGIEESARLMREALGFTVQLTTEWHRLAVESARRAAEAITIKA